MHTFDSVTLFGATIADAGKIRLGGAAPTLPTADAGRVRLGGAAPALPTADAGKVRLACRI